MGDLNDAPSAREAQVDPEDPETRLDVLRKQKLDQLPVDARSGPPASLSSYAPGSGQTCICPPYQSPCMLGLLQYLCRTVDLHICAQVSCRLMRPTSVMIYLGRPL